MEKLISRLELEIVQVNSDAELLDLVIKDGKEDKRLEREKFLFLNQYPTRFTKPILSKLDTDFPITYMNDLLGILENSQTPNLDSIFIKQFKYNWPSIYFDTEVNLVLGFKTKRANDFLVNLLLDPNLAQEKKIFIAGRFYYSINRFYPSKDEIKLLSKKNIMDIYAVAKENKNDLLYLSFLLGVIGKCDEKLLIRFYKKEYGKHISKELVEQIIKSIDGSWQKNISQEFLKLHSEIISN